MLSNNCLQFSVYVVILEHVLVKVYTTEKAANMLVNAKHKTYFEEPPIIADCYHLE